jgi:copper transport protein
MRVGASAGGLLLLLVVFVGLPGRAEAHALLRRATPPTGQTLPSAPAEIRLLFSEPLDPTFSRVRVLDASGRPVDNGDARVDPTDEYELVATLPDGLPNGVYTVDWRSLSTIDVHPDFGRYPLFVGVPVTASTQSTSFSESGSGPATAVARWAFYLTVSLFGGAIVTWKLVFSGLLVGGYAAARPVAAQRAHRGIVVGGLLLVLATAFAAVAQASAAAGVPLLSGIGPPLADLLGRGRFAAIWWPRFLLELMALGLIAFGGLEGLAADMAVAMVPAILLTSSLTSHGAALPGVPGAGTVLDWLHLLSGVVWIGGLASLVVVLPPAVRMLPADAGLVRAAVGRFSRLALLAAGLVAVSGTVQAALELGSVSALTGTSYGQVVLLKVGLLVAMLVLALLNQRRAAVIAWFRQGVRLELLVGVAVLAAAAVLTGIPPAR